MAKAAKKQASKKKADKETPPPSIDETEAPPVAAEETAAPETAIAADPPSGACQNCGFNLNLVEGKRPGETVNCPNCGFEPGAHEQLVKEHHG